MEETTGSEKRGRKRTREGVVVSNRMKKTIVIAITRQVRHAFYHKYIRRTTKFMAHDESEQCNIGDTVRIVESRRISKNKKWRVQKILSKAV